MYQVDKKDKVIELNDLPISSPGAPIPLVLADEYNAVISYYMRDPVISNGEELDQVAIIKFKDCLSIIFGPPNDEAFNGHPLADRGLSPYSFFMIENSSWLRNLIDMNRVHPNHKDSMFDDYKHYILSFHDSVFECICTEFEYVISQGTLMDNLNIMKERLG